MTGSPSSVARASVVWVAVMASGEASSPQAASGDSMAEGAACPVGDEGARAPGSIDAGSSIAPAGFVSDMFMGTS